MAQSRYSVALWLVGGAAVVALALLAESEIAPEPTRPKPPPPPPPEPPAPPRKPPAGQPPVHPDDASDDETALARMLASEDSRRAVKVVLGWLAVQTARRRKVSLYKLLTGGSGYGPQVRGDVVHYASTRRRPSAQDRDLARKLLSGSLQPSAAIRRHKPGAWVQRKVKPSVSDDYILHLQEGFEEGIYGRIAGTEWVLYSRDTPKIALVPFPNATARLDALPQVPALDSAQA